MNTSNRSAVEPLIMAATIGAVVTFLIDTSVSWLAASTLLLALWLASCALSRYTWYEKSMTFFERGYAATMSPHSRLYRYVQDCTRRRLAGTTEEEPRLISRTPTTLSRRTPPPQAAPNTDSEETRRLKVDVLHSLSAIT